MRSPKADETRAYLVSFSFVVGSRKLLSFDRRHKIEERRRSVFRYNFIYLIVLCCVVFSLPANDFLDNYQI